MTYSNNKNIISEQTLTNFHKAGKQDSEKNEKVDLLTGYLMRCVLRRWPEIDTYSKQQ